MSPSCRRETISVPGKCRAACVMNDEMSSGMSIIWPRKGLCTARSPFLGLAGLLACWLADLLACWLPSIGQKQDRRAAIGSPGASVCRAGVWVLHPGVRPRILLPLRVTMARSGVRCDNRGKGHPSRIPPSLQDPDESLFLLGTPSDALRVTSSSASWRAIHVAACSAFCKPRYSPVRGAIHCAAACSCAPHGGTR